MKTFHQSIHWTILSPKKEMTAKFLSMFAGTYVSEQLFSLMNLKSRFRSQLADAHLN